MADLKRRRDNLIRPKHPKAWKMRYLLLRRVALDPTRRHAGRLFHGVEGGCPASRGSDPGSIAFTEAMVYTDDDGLYWMADPAATENQLDGWRTIIPCKVCGLVDLDAIISERLKWQEHGRCYRTYHPGFFATEGGDGTGGRLKQLREEALAMCCGDTVRGYAPCPVIASCQSWGLRLHALLPLVGILGGLDEQDRRNATRSP